MPIVEDSLDIGSEVSLSTSEKAGIALKAVTFNQISQ